MYNTGPLASSLQTLKLVTIEFGVLSTQTNKNKLKLAIVSIIAKIAVIWKQRSRPINITMI